MQISYSRDKYVEDDDVTLYGVEVLNGVTVSGIPPHCLPIKVGGLIILTKNLHIATWNYNSTRYIVHILNIQETYYNYEKTQITH